MYTMSEDAKAIVLLCGRLGGRGDAEPLRQLEYNRLVHWLIGEGLRPADLLDHELSARAAPATQLHEDRLAALLGRGVQLGFAVERWNQSGLWVICRSDPDYPARLKAHLREKAPPVLFGAGDQALLRGGGLAVVGSRDVDDEGREFTRAVASWCARGDLTIVSGGARGVDQTAMSVALQSGGSAIGVLASDLLKRSVSREARQALTESRLLLISPFHPEARFTVGTAMGRNKLIYAMADYALVVSAAHEKGGTWQGAVEELRREPHRSVFVRLSDSAPEGNRKLLERGAARFPAWSPSDAPEVLLGAEGNGTPAVPTAQPTLFDHAQARSADRRDVRESPPQAGDARRETIASAPRTHPRGVYEAALPVILAALDDAVTLDELARRLDVAKGQLQTWLNRAADAKRVRKLTRPTRYIRRER